jgi:hypothetical protein
MSALVVILTLAHASLRTTSTNEKSLDDYSDTCGICLDLIKPGIPKPELEIFTEFCVPCIGMHPKLELRKEINVKHPLGKLLLNQPLLMQS